MEENFKTFTAGLFHIFKDGALMVEEQNHGRILPINNKVKKRNLSIKIKMEI